MRNKRKLPAETAETARGSSSSLPVIWLGCSVRCPQRSAFQHGKAHSAEDSGHYNACEWNESFTRARELRASARHRHRRFLEAAPRTDKSRKQHHSNLATQRWRCRRGPAHDGSATISNRSHRRTEDPSRAVSRHFSAATPAHRQRSQEFGLEKLRNHSTDQLLQG